ncbi:Uncharacterized protein FWK35_00019549, partial [Aphis craccivora]
MNKLDLTSKRLLQNLNDNITIVSESNGWINEKYAVLFYLLHTIFVPTSKNSFMIFKSSIAEIENIYLNDVMKIHQPFISICGTPSKPKEIIVFFGCMKFKLFSIYSEIDNIRHSTYTMQFLYYLKPRVNYK